MFDRRYECLLDTMSLALLLRAALADKAGRANRQRLGDGCSCPTMPLATAELLEQLPRAAHEGNPRLRMQQPKLADLLARVSLPGEVVPTPAAAAAAAAAQAMCSYCPHGGNQRSDLGSPDLAAGGGGLARVKVSHCFSESELEQVLQPGGSGIHSAVHTGPPPVLICSLAEQVRPQQWFTIEDEYDVGLGPWESHPFDSIMVETAMLKMENERLRMGNNELLQRLGSAQLCIDRGAALTTSFGQTEWSVPPACSLVLATTSAAAMQAANWWQTSEATFLDHRGRQEQPSIEGGLTELAGDPKAVADIAYLAAAANIAEEEGDEDPGLAVGTMDAHLDSLEPVKDELEEHEVTLYRDVEKLITTVHDEPVDIMNVILVSEDTGFRPLLGENKEQTQVAWLDSLDEEEDSCIIAVRPREMLSLKLKEDGDVDEDLLPPEEIPVQHEVPTIGQPSIAYNYNRLGAATCMCSEECNSSNDNLDDDCPALAVVEDAQEMLSEVKLPPEPAEVLGVVEDNSELDEILMHSSARQIKAAKNKEKRKRNALQRLARVHGIPRLGATDRGADMEPHTEEFQQLHLGPAEPQCPPCFNVAPSESDEELPAEPTPAVQELCVAACASPGWLCPGVEATAPTFPALPEPKTDLSIAWTIDEAKVTIATSATFQLLRIELADCDVLGIEGNVIGQDFEIVVRAVHIDRVVGNGRARDLGASIVRQFGDVLGCVSASIFGLQEPGTKPRKTR